MRMRISKVVGIVNKKFMARIYPKFWIGRGFAETNDPRVVAGPFQKEPQKIIILTSDTPQGLTNVMST